MRNFIEHLQVRYRTNHGPDLMHEVALVMRRRLTLLSYPSLALVLIAVSGRKLIITGQPVGQMKADTDAIALNLSSEDVVAQTLAFVDYLELQGDVQERMHEIATIE